MSTSNARIARIFSSVEYGFASGETDCDGSKKPLTDVDSRDKTWFKTMISNRSLSLTVFGIWAVLTLRLGFAAAEHADWRGFVVTEIQLIVAGLALAYMLRTEREKP